MSLRPVSPYLARNSLSCFTSVLVVESICLKNDKIQICVRCVARKYDHVISYIERERFGINSEIFYTSSMRSCDFLAYSAKVVVRATIRWKPPAGPCVLSTLTRVGYIKKKFNSTDSQGFKCNRFMFHWVADTYSLF